MTESIGELTPERLFKLRLVAKNPNIPVKIKQKAADLLAKPDSFLSKDVGYMSFLDFV